MKHKITAFFLFMIFSLVLCGVVSAADNNTVLNTTHSGTVSGDLYVNATQPVGFADQPSSGVTSREFNQTYNLPTNESAQGTDIEWAEIYVNIYSGSGSANWPVNATILLDGDGDGIYETTLGNELLTSTRYTKDGSVIWINDHCTRVYSDYQLWYDVTGLITCKNPSIYIKTEQVGTETFDGRLKMIALLVAYNDGDNDKVDYWVNDGQDWISSGTSQTTFNTSNVLASATNATLNTVALSSKDGTYDFNGETHNGTDPVAPVNYFVTHMWNVTANVTRGNNSTLTYTAGSGSFKNVLATLAIKEALVVPVANFTVSNATGFAPLPVQFTDTSTGTVTGWAWDFDGDGITDSTEQNPTYTYRNAGTYNVNLTVTGAGSTDTETRTSYITITANTLADTAWPKYMGNSNNTGQSPYNGPQTNNTLWTYNTGTINYASAVIGADGTIYIGSYGTNTLYAINPDGTLKWSYITGGKIYHSAAIATDGTIYFGSRDSKLYALNPDGTLKWTYTAGSGFYAPPTIGTDGTIYIGSADKKIYALNPDGTVKWSYSAGSSIQSSITIATDGTIYFVGGSSAFYALNPNGTLKWIYTYGGTNQVSSPSIGADGTIYFGTYNRGLFALNPDGTLKWKYTSTGNIYGSTPAIATDGTIYIGSYNGNLYAFNPDGTVKWSYSTGSSVRGSAAIGADGTICFICGNDMIYALNPNGTMKWSYATGTAQYGASSPAIAPDGTLYIGSWDGNLYVFRNAIAPVASFTSTVTDGRPSYIPLTFQFTDTSSNYPKSWLWDFGDGTNSTEQNPSHTYTVAGNYSVSLTATNPAGNDTVVKTDYIVVNERPVDTEAPVVTASPAGGIITAVTNVTLSATDNWDSDLPIYYTLDGTDPTTLSTLYTDHITITSTTILKFISVDTSNNTSPVQTEIYTVNDTEAPVVDAVQNWTTVTLSSTDNMDSNPQIYYTTNGEDPTTSSTPYSGPINIPAYATTFVKFIAVDASGNVSPVQNRTYITFHTDSALQTGYYAEGNVGVVISNGGTSYGWFAYHTTETGTVNYTVSSLNIPEGATILTARLYQAWTWYGYPGYSLTFNGYNVTRTAFYSGTDGVEVFDVTSYFNILGDNIATITSGGGANYATILVVVYQSTTEPYRKIWVNEGFNLVYESWGYPNGYSIFNNVNTTNMKSATITAILPSGDGSDGDSISINGKYVGRNSTGGSDPSFNYYNVTGVLQDGTDEMAIGAASYYSLATAILTVTMEPKPVANFDVNITNGIVPMTVQFTDKSTNATGWSWDFDNDGTVDSNEQNPVYNYQTPGTYTVKLTVTGPGGEDVEEKLNYITVVSLYDLAVTGAVDVIPTGKNTVFAKETNPVQFTLSNNGSSTANSILVALYASDVSSTVPVATITIGSLAAGASTNIELIDPTLRDLEGGPVTYTIKIDPENTIIENNETDNAKNSTVNSVKYNGYKGKQYWEGGNNVTTQRTYDIDGNVVYSQGDSSYHGGGWKDYTVTWSEIQPIIPSTASITEAWLYVPYTWDETGLVPNNLTLTFNGYVLNYVNWYVDQANFGTYANYKYGLLTFNVTGFYNKNGVNSLFIDRNGSGSIAMYPCNLMVIYEDANSTRKQIFINEETDLLGFSPTSYGTTLDEATAYVPFTGLVIDTSKVKNATFYSSAGNAGPDEGNFFWNGSLITSNAWNGTSTGIFTLVKDVTNYITSTGNIVGIQGTNSGGMVALQQVLVVEYAPDLVVTNITANKGAGDNLFANEPNNITITITNQGASASPESTLNVNINGTTYTVIVPALNAGASTNVSVTDTDSRANGDTVPINAATDPSNNIPETNESNNNYSVTLTVYNNGYKGKRYTDGDDMGTEQTFEGNYEVIYSSGDSAYRSGGTNGSNWNNAYTVTWTSTELVIPEGATVVQARLYQPYTWNTALGVPDFVASFNGNLLTYLAHYNDTKGYGTSNYPSGLLVYDVTSFFQNTGNTLTLTKGINTTTSLYGSYMVVIYQDSNATYKRIYINDGTDLLCSSNSFSVNDTEATAYATYNNINTTNLGNASVVVVMASADKSGQSKFFFNGHEYPGFNDSYNSTSQTGFSVYNVFGNVNSGSNLAAIQSYNSGTTGDNMVALNSIMILTFDTTAPIVNASLESGLFNTTKTVTLSVLDDQDSNPVIYYTTDGSTPTTSSTVYVGPIVVASTTTLRFFAVDDAGNEATVQTETYIIDTTMPLVMATPDSGIFNTTKTVTLEATDNVDTNPVIYYTTDGTAPTTGSSVYTGPITMGTTTTLRFFAVDDVGNPSIVQTKTYTIDTVAPEVNADLDNGTFEIVKSVNLTATDNLDTNPTIYYTTDGTTPTTSSTKYTGPITVDKAMKLRFFAVDDAGNTSPVGSRTYDVKSDVYVEVTASNDAPIVGDTVRYKFKLGNYGPGIATDVVFIFQIPEGMEYVGVVDKDSGSVDYNPNNRTITWTLDEVAVGDPYLLLDLRVVTAGTYLFQPAVASSNYNPGLLDRVGSLRFSAVVRATSTAQAVTTNNVQATHVSGIVPMQTTGIPLGALLVGLLCIVSGLGLRRRF
jgi:PKD repeat protein